MPYLKPEEIKFYKDNGFIKLNNIFSEAEMDEMCKEYNFIFETKNNEGMESSWAGDEMKKQANFINYSVKSIHNLQFHSSVFSKSLMNEKLLNALEDVMNTKNILLHHTKAHFKPPENGAPYLMHQDYHYFPFRDHSMVAVFIHLDDTTPENGGLAVYPGSHKLGPQVDSSAADVS
ncbi:putative alpha-ketoglutarate-dependent hypophosphite dioxygenase [Arctopsyche grandis]|uniref:putative alpha-ketoglutarate-dependent hypophosphite dioxygenase n=1 Tax=Arctopsyche grandis TaxID=121162 RepID=UPI00406D7276